MASAPLVTNEAPPAYSGPPPAGYKQDGQAGYPAGYQGGPPPYQGGGPAGYAGPPGYQGGAQPSYMAGQAPQQAGGVIIVQTPPSQAPVVVVGGCPACRVGVLEDDFSVLGVCCAILFFPIGILCCLAMRQRHCPNCGAVFG